jgi:hypothetical protein
MTLWINPPSMKRFRSSPRSGFITLPAGTWDAFWFYGILGYSRTGFDATIWTRLSLALHSESEASCSEPVLSSRRLITATFLIV